jgi:hypothetical protein
MLTNSQILLGYGEIFGTSYTPAQVEISFWANRSGFTIVNLPAMICRHYLTEAMTADYLDSPTLKALKLRALHYLYYSPTTELLHPMANWTTPVIERVSFHTDILQSRYGRETRHGLVYYPKIQLEYDILVYFELYQHFVNQVNYIQGRTIGIPQWHLMKVLTHALVDSGNLLTDGELVPGKYILFASYAHTEEVELELTGGILWFKNQVEMDLNTTPWIVPISKGSIRDKISLSMISAAAATGKVSADIKPNGGDTRNIAKVLPKIGDYPIFNEELNWVTPASMDLIRPTTLLDYGTGVTVAYDLHMYSDTLRTFTFVGRKGAFGVRDMFYQMKGKLKAFYLPSFTADMNLIKGFKYSHVTQSFQVVAAGLADAYTLANLTKFLYVKFKNREPVVCKFGQPVEHNGIETVPVFATNGSADPFPFDWTEDDVISISFLTLSRFNSDIIEISWITPDLYQASVTFTNIQQ